MIRLILSLSLVNCSVLPPFILVIALTISYTCAENECESLFAVRKTVGPAASRRRRRVLFAGTPQPAPAAPRHGPPGGSQQSHEPDAAAGKPAAHLGGATDVQFRTGTARVPGTEATGAGDRNGGVLAGIAGPGGAACEQGTRPL